MSDLAIRAVDLSKRYRLDRTRDGHATLRDQLTASLRGLSLWHRGPRLAPATFWALEHVSFEIQRGEAVGLIGRNGAGKSTLLKILSRITEPTTGRAEVYGRVRSLLEVGTGFHPELSGRENVYLNGSLLGMKRREIAAKFDAIVDFAEVAMFIDTPVKRYSSGMYVRLAFAVAAHMEPEILIVDEVLAVGDLAFQGKCLAHMRALSNRGLTIVFVSHNIQAIRDVCQRAVLLAQGKVIADGGVNAVISTYHASLASARVGEVLPSQYFRLEALRVNGREVGKALELRPHSPVVFDLEFEVIQALRGATLNIVIELPDRRCVLHWRSDVAGLSLDLALGRHILTVEAPDLGLSPGAYWMWFRVVSLDPSSPTVWDTEPIELLIGGLHPLAGVVWPRHVFRHRHIADRIGGKP
jgi:lipopolysaccharide transport system ATP-binding protein